MRPPYGNSFFVHWRFENPASVWADYENISVYPRRLLEAIRDQGLRPRATRRLYPLLYGIQKDAIPVRSRICTTIPTIWIESVSMRAPMPKNVPCPTGVSRPMRAFFSSTALQGARLCTANICIFWRLISTIREWILPSFARWNCCPKRRSGQRSILLWTSSGKGERRRSAAFLPCTMQTGSARDLHRAAAL